MKKFTLILLSLLIFIIGAGFASATEINSIDDAPDYANNHQCGADEINSSIPKVVQDNTNINTDNSIVNSPYTSVTGTGDEANTSTIFEDSTCINTILEKQDPLKKDIENYNNHFQENHYKTLSNGKKYSEMDLILEIYKHNPFEDTVIIATKVLMDNGVRTNFNAVQLAMYQMINGTIYTEEYQMGASYYKDEMRKIQESHKSLNSETKKYIEIFNKKNGKAFAVNPNLHYCYLDIIVEIYAVHPNIDETILIATQTLKNCGNNITAASVNDTFNQMMSGTITPENGVNPMSYYLDMNTIRIAHERGLISQNDDVTNRLMEVI